MTYLKFKLDDAIPEEAALKQRLRRLPKDRHAEYMRNLALQGFRQECADLDRPQANSAATRTFTPASLPAPTQGESLDAETDSNRTIERLENPGTVGDVSLASLKQIVG